MGKYKTVVDPRWTRTDTYDSGAVVHYMLEEGADMPDTPALCGVRDVAMIGLDTARTIDADDLGLRDAWEHFRSTYRGTIRDADEALARWAAIFHGVKVTTHNGTGYSQGDTWTLAIVQPLGDESDYAPWAHEWINWARGDVYTVEVELPNGTEVLSGFYGDPDETWAADMWELGTLVDTDCAY